MADEDLTAQQMHDALIGKLEEVLSKMDDVIVEVKVVETILTDNLSGVPASQAEMSTLTTRIADAFS